MKKVAVFVDWDNLRNTIEDLQRVTERREFNYNEPRHLSKLFKCFLNDDEEFYRIYIYTAEHLTIPQIESHLNSALKDKFQKFLAKNIDYEKKIEVANTFLKNIVKEDHIALRTGKMIVNGLKASGYPNLAQKQVDMLLGLDISHIAHMSLADNILIFSKDTDMIPAMKVARINGLSVVIANFAESNHISEGLVKHTDVMRTKSFISDIIPAL